MRVAQLNPTCLPITGGTEIDLYRLSDSLIRAGIITEIIAFFDRKRGYGSRGYVQKTIGSVPVLIWPSCSVGKIRVATSRLLKCSSFPVHISSLRRYAETFDVLHFHDENDLTLPVLMLHSRKPRLFSFNGLGTDSILFYKRNAIARNWLLKSADLFHVYSHSDRDILLSLGVKNEAIRVLRAGVDLDAFRPARKPKRTLDTIHITFVGRIERTKGLDSLLKAIEILKLTCLRRRIIVNIIGKPWDLNYYSQLCHYKAKKRLDEVKFLGFAEYSKLPGILRDSDIFVFPALSAPGQGGAVNIEAMATGVPIVASSVGGISEIIADGETGLLVPPNDPDKLASKLQTLIDDDGLRSRMGRLARNRAKSLFSAELHAKMMIEIYNELTDA